MSGTIQPRLWIGVLAAILLALPGAAHDYHESLAEIDYNEERGFIEVALRVIPEDFEAALARRHGGQRLALEAGEESDRRTIAYLREHFVIRGPSGAIPLQWVGKEISHRAAWFYFEIPIPLVDDPPRKPSFSLENRLLFELEPTQKNHVLFRSKKKITSWIFTTETRPRPLPLFTEMSTEAEEP